MPQTLAAFAPAIGQLGGGLLGGALGGGGDRRSFQFPDVIAGGLQLGETASGQIFVTPRGEEGRRRTGLVSGLAGQFRTLGQEIGGLRERVGPGAEALLQSRLNAISSARSRTIGTISENLSRRRVLGSSFGQAAIAQAEREFAEAEADARAQTFLEGLEIEQQLITSENAALAEAFNTELNELNLQFQAGTIPLGGAIQAQTQNSLLQQQLAAQSAQGFGAFGAQLGGVLGGLSGGPAGSGGLPVGGSTPPFIPTDTTGRIFGGI